MKTVNLAASSDLVGTYHEMFDGILNSAAGQLLTKIGAAAAVILALGLIAGLLCKAFGRSNKLVTTFCPNFLRIVVVILLTFVLAGPVFSIPLLLTIFDWFVNAFGNQASDYLTS